MICLMGTNVQKIEVGKLLRADPEVCSFSCVSFFDVHRGRPSAIELLTLSVQRRAVPPGAGGRPGLCSSTAGAVCHP